MKTKVAGLALTAAMALSATSANAATYTIPLAKVSPGTYSTTFTVSPGAGSFLDTFLFNLPRANGRATVSVSSLETAGPATNVNFNATNVKFNGTTLPILSRGVYELRLLVDSAVNGGASRLVVQGASGALGNYTGVLTYAIPEPAMWAMMILGFGFVGAALRTSRRKVTFAAA